MTALNAIGLAMGIQCGGRRVLIEGEEDTAMELIDLMALMEELYPTMTLPRKRAIAYATVLVSQPVDVTIDCETRDECVWLITSLCAILTTIQWHSQFGWTLSRLDNRKMIEINRRPGQVSLLTCRVRSP